MQNEKIIVLRVEDMFLRKERKCIYVNLEDIVLIQCLDNEDVNERENRLFYDERDRMLSNEKWEDREWSGDECEFDSYHD